MNRFSVKILSKARNFRRISTTVATRPFGRSSASSLPIIGIFAILSGVAFKSYSSENKVSLCSSNGSIADKYADTSLYPPIKPYKEGMIKASQFHNIAYSLYGNPRGKPVLVIHGGPGAGTSPDMARFFDPEVYRIVLVDQRGAGKSKPFGETKENSTDLLIQDFEGIRQWLKVDKWQLFGGSWGSTLALAYAEKHPEAVSEIVLRGVFLCREKELRWMYEGEGANYIFPEDWQIFESFIPPKERGNMILAYSKRLSGALGRAEMLNAARIWSKWEGRISKLQQDSWEDVSKKFDDSYSTTFAKIENHYFMNKVFFPRDAYLLEKENIDKIKDIPVAIVQGRYDIVCPAISAYDLNKKLNNSTITYTLAGHSAFETENIKHLVEATERFKHNFQKREEE